MKPDVILRISVRRLAMRMIIAVCAVIAQQAALLQGNGCVAYGQSAAKSSGQTRTQKLANPLNDLLDEAQRDIESSNFEAAIAPLQKFLAEQPNVAFAHFQLAYAYTALKRVEEARAEYERAIAIDPKMSEAYLNLGLLLLNDYPAPGRANRGYPEAAIQPLRKAVELLPTQSRPRYLLALALERSGNGAEAVESMQASLRLDPNDFDARSFLGFHFLRNHQPAEAENQFRRAVEIQPGDSTAWNGLAQSLDQQKSPEAIATYRQYLERVGGDRAVNFRIAEILFQQEKFDEALTELDRADGGSPPTAGSIKLRADIEIGQKKWDDATATLQKAIALAPGDAELHGGLGRVYLQKRDFQAAEKELKAAIQIDHNNIVFWKDLSSTYYLGGDFSRALAALDVVAKAETPGAGAWFIRALCYDKLNQFQPALDAYQKFLVLDKDQNPDQVWQAQQRSKVLRRKLEEKK
jgi:protein O-GlcNAc transferase